MHQRIYGIAECRQNEEHEKLRKECEDFKNYVNSEKT